jgi:hypothetical protein
MHRVAILVRTLLAVTAIGLENAFAAHAELVCTGTRTNFIA